MSSYAKVFLCYAAFRLIWYLHLCSVSRVTVLDDQDSASVILKEDNNGSGEFVRVTPKPTVTISPGDERARALELHNEAHRLCFIARSVRFAVEIVPEIIAAWETSE